jgi:hypothetical protein
MHGIRYKCVSHHTRCLTQIVKQWNPVRSKRRYSILLCYSAICADTQSPSVSRHSERTYNQEDNPSIDCVHVMQPSEQLGSQALDVVSAIGNLEAHH